MLIPKLYIIIIIIRTVVERWPVEQKVPGSIPGEGLDKLFAFDESIPDHQKKCHNFGQNEPIRDLKTVLKSGQCLESFGLSQNILKCEDILVGTFLPKNRAFTLDFHRQASSNLSPCPYDQ